MKPFSLLALFAAVIAAPLYADSVLLTDNFNGSSLDPSKWNTILPYGSSSVIESGGTVTTTGRGIVASADQFFAPYVVSGSFTMLDSLEHFNIFLRSDLSASATGSSNERTGVIVTFVNDGDGVSIQQYPTGTDWAQLASTGGGGYVLNTGQAYTFSILDTGSTIDVAVNGINLISGTTSFSTGNHLGFYSREFGSTATQVDSITVTSVPEAGATALFLGMGLVGLAGIARRKLA